MTENRSGLILVISALFLVAAFIELSYGSFYLGILFLALFILMLLLTKKTTSEQEFKPSHLRLVFGLILIFTVTVYNIHKNSEFQTLDSMVFLLGLSLVISNFRKFAVIGRFSIYFSSIFLLFYISLFLIPETIGFDLPYYYGHYFVTLPVVAVLQNLGYNITVPEMRFIEVYGVEQTILKIDLACFGWYSLLLILSMVLAYSETIEKIEKRKLVLILITLSFASYLANLLRVAILVHLTYFYGTKTMLTVHSHLGWIIFALLLLPLVKFMIFK